MTTARRSSKFLATAAIGLAVLSAIPTDALAQKKQPAQEQSVEDLRWAGVVRVENSAIIPDYSTPWNGGRPSGGNGTGWMVGKNQFITNAHVVSNANKLVIRKVGNPEPLPAEIVHIAHDCDLALLRLLDPTPFKGVKPLEIGGIPKLDTEVIAVGYPIGGDRMSVTRGVVSRIDFRNYSHTQMDMHLSIQVDAAINPGNSGGPVIQNGKVVGVAFQGYSGDVAQNVGYMIPVPVINRFLKDIEDGSYDHYVDLAASDMSIQNPAQIKALGLPKSGQGVMISSVSSGGTAGGVLKVGDVLLEIAGNPVLSNGLINLEGELVDMAELIERKFAGDKVDVVVWRDGKRKKLTLELKRFTPPLMMAKQYKARPRYVMHAGLVFQPLDRAVMAGHGIKNQVVNNYFRNFTTDEIYLERPEPVVFTKVLPDSINTFHKGYIHNIVDEVNGVKITCLKDLHEALTNPKDDSDFTVIKLVEQGRPLVLDRKRIPEAHARVMKTYGLPSDHFLGEEKVPEPKTKQPDTKKKNPVKATPSKNTPVKPAPAKPVKPAPSEPTPAKPIKPAPVQPAPVKPIKPAPAEPAPVKPAKPAPAKPAPINPAPAKPLESAPNKPAPAPKK